MKTFKSTFYLMIGIGLILSIVSCNDDDDNNDAIVYEERVVVANRGSGSISFINADSNELIKTLPIEGSQPMYVVYVPSTDRLYVGDRALNKVHIVNPLTKTVESSIDVGKGVFHMWADGLGKQLWVNNDIDNTISVINLTTNAVQKTISLDMKPHDVFVSQDGAKAYVSVFNSNASMPDKVYMFSTSTFEKTAEANVGKDPHLFLLSNSNQLFVPCQSGELYSLNGSNLSQNSVLNITGAHGIYPSPNQDYVFVTNISGNQLYSVKSTDNTLNGTVSSLQNTPHNIVVNASGNKMFVTHSGAAADKVTTYSINNGILTAGTTISAGINPFGLTYYKRIVD